MKKKLLSLALVLVMALTLLPTAAFAEEDDDLDASNKLLASQSEDANQETPQADHPHVHTLTHHEEKPATCADTGIREYWSCSGCGKNFLSDNNTAPDSAAVTEAGLVLEKTTDHDWSNKDGVCKVCKTACDHKGDAVKNDATCSVCGATIAAAKDCGHYVDRTKVTRKDATCGESGYAMTGDEAWYCSECRAYYTTAAGNTKTSVTEIPATGSHTPKPGTYTAPSVTGHKFTCSVCEKEVSEGHTFGNDNVCDYCGFVRGGSGSTSPSSHIDVTSATVRSYSISVTWYSDLPAGTQFDISVDGSTRSSGVSPSKSSSGYFSYTVDFSRYLGDRYYDVTVCVTGDHTICDTARAYNRDYDYDDDYWYNGGSYRPNSTPGTNSSGIPYASQVNGRYSASEAIRILRNTNHANLQYNLLNSTSASNSFADLEAKVKDHNDVTVRVNTDNAPSGIRNVRILGAAFNAASTNSTVRLEVGAPSQRRYAGYPYEFSMSLTGVGGDSSLDVPVKITMSIPSDISASTVRILHFHNSSVPDVIDPVVSGGSMSFTLTGFSDFVITDNRTDPYYYYYAPVTTPAAPRRSLIDEHLAIVLPILASMPPSGYVYDDVPPTYWAASEIAWARDGGMMSGYYDGTFQPYAATTRQELWMVLGRLAGARPADMWDARQWAMSAGITDGQNPHSPLSRQQMIAMLYRYAQYLGKDVSAQANLQGCRDVSMISGYARNAMAWAVEQGIVTGDGNGCLNPQDIATRADFAVYLYRFVN